MGQREYLGQLELMVLLATLRAGRDAYGLIIANTIVESGGREVALSSIYAALERLETKGLVVSTLGEPTAERGGKAKTYFKVTPAGTREARQVRATLTRLWRDLPGLRGELS